MRQAKIVLSFLEQAKLAPEPNRVGRLEAGAFDVELTPADLDRIAEVSPVGAAAGDRYADMGFVSR